MIAIYEMWPNGSLTSFRSACHKVVRYLCFRPERGSAKEDAFNLLSFPVELRVDS